MNRVFTLVLTWAALVILGAQAQAQLEGAEERLRDFAKKWDRGRFDKGELTRRSQASSMSSTITICGRRTERFRAMREAYDRHEIGYGRP